MYKIIVHTQRVTEGLFTTLDFVWFSVFLGWLIETEGKLCIANVFVEIDDPRQAKKVRHNLVELLVVAICAVVTTLLSA